MFYVEVQDKVYFKMKLLVSEDIFSFDNNIFRIESNLDVPVSIKDCYGNTVRTVSSLDLFHNKEIIGQLINLTINLNYIFIYKMNTFCSDLLFFLRNAKDTYYSMLDSGIKYICTWGSKVLFTLGEEEIVALGSDCRSALTYKVITNPNSSTASIRLWRDGQIVETQIFQYSKGNTIIKELRTNKVTLEMLDKLSG